MHRGEKLPAGVKKRRSCRQVFRRIVVVGRCEENDSREDKQTF